MKQGELTRSGKTCARTGRRSPGGKRIFAALLALTMVLALLPGTALAAAPTEVWVGSTDVTSGYTTAQTLYDGTVRYSGGVLYLSNNVNVPNSASHNNSAIYADGDLTIELTGTNTVTGPNTSGNSYGVFVNGRLTVRGTGSLNANGGTASDANAQSYGVYIIGENGAINVTGGTLSGTGGSAYKDSYGVYVDENGAISVTGGTLSGTGGAARSVSVGVYACNDSSTTVSGSGTLTGNGGKDPSDSTGVQINGSVTVSGSGTLTGTGSDAKSQSYGLRVLGNGYLTVTGGSVTGKGGTANADSNTPASFGVYVLNAVTVSGGSLTGRGGSDRRLHQSTGVYGLRGVKVSGGTLTAQAGTATDSCGVRTDSDSNIVLTGGSTLATGETSAVSKQPQFSDATQASEYWYRWKENEADAYKISGSGTGNQFSNTSAKYLKVTPVTLPISITPSTAFPVGSSGGDRTVTVGHGTGLVKGEIGSLSVGTDRLTENTDYTKENSASVDITLKESWLNSLSAGTHRLNVPVTSGTYAPQTPYVDIVVIGTGGAGGDVDADIPKTGDVAMPLLWAGLALLAGAGLIVLKKRRRA